MYIQIYPQINLVNYYQQLDMTEILDVQNEVSADEENGYIWVLNTCVFFVAELLKRALQNLLKNKIIISL